MRLKKKPEKSRVFDEMKDRARRLKRVGDSKQNRRRKAFQLWLQDFVDKHNIEEAFRRGAVLDLASPHIPERADAATKIGQLGDVRLVEPLLMALKSERKIKVLVLPHSIGIALGELAPKILEGDAVALKRLEVARKNIHAVHLGQKGLLLYWLATNPKALAQVPLASERKNLDYLINLSRQAEELSIDEMTEILGFFKRKGKK